MLGRRAGGGGRKARANWSPYSHKVASEFGLHIKTRMFCVSICALCKVDLEIQMALCSDGRHTIARWFNTMHIHAVPHHFVARPEAAQSCAVLHWTPVLNCKH